MIADTFTIQRSRGRQSVATNSLLSSSVKACFTHRNLRHTQYDMVDLHRIFNMNF